MRAGASTRNATPLRYGVVDPLTVGTSREARFMASPSVDAEARRPTSRQARFWRNLSVENLHFIEQLFLDVVLAREAP
jgi:hypothetical protein